MDLVQSTALAGGLAWASGFRLYAAVLLLGLLGRYRVSPLIMRKTASKGKFHA